MIYWDFMVKIQIEAAIEGVISMRHEKRWCSRTAIAMLVYWRVSYYILIWLVVWLPWILFSKKYWVANHPKWRSYFQRGGPTTNQLFIGKLDAMPSGVIKGGWILPRKFDGNPAVFSFIQWGISSQPRLTSRGYIAYFVIFMFISILFYTCLIFPNLIHITMKWMAQSTGHFRPSKLGIWSPRIFHMLRIWASSEVAPSINHPWLPK